MWSKSQPACKLHAAARSQQVCPKAARRAHDGLPFAKIVFDGRCTELSDDAWRTTGLPSVPVTPVVRSVCPALLSLDFRQTLDMDAEGSCSSTSSGLSKPSRHSTSSMSSCPWRPRLASIHAGEVTRAVSPLAAFQREENARRPHTRCLGQRQPGNVLKNQHGDFNSQPGRKQPRSMSRCSEQHKRVT
ncbi:unnamed protein product [Symbiodinium microadriaticum]|nr:unnamed protein product [Symbiodinium microadriaticum]